MKFSQRTRAVLKSLAVVMALAMPVAITLSSVVDARPSSGGSRGSRTFSAPPTTKTAPNAAQPMQRTITQPGVNTPAAAPAGGGFFNRPGMGMLGGLAAGFLGAGLLGMLFGGGLFSGLGSLSSIFGLILQLGLIYLVVRLAMSWWQRRNAGNQPALANASAGPNAAQQHQYEAPQQHARTGFGFGMGGGAQPPLDITPDDYDTFERMLTEINEAWSNEDVNRLQTLATPEMASYFAQDIAENNSRGRVNKVTGVKLLQGDLAEAWREGPTDYATLAMRFALTDKTLDKATGKVVEGSETPIEATEVWTFVRRHGGNWELSAIQQA